MKVKYSWIFPIRNEARSLPQLIKEISQIMKDSSYEIIAVNDASTDSSLSILKSLLVTPTGGRPFGSEPQGRRLGGSIKILNFHTIQGKWASLKAGFKKAQGKIIITLDSDLQDDPGQLPRLLAKFNQGYDLVSGWRRIRKDSLVKNWISKLGNKLASILTNHHYLDLNSPFKVYRRDVLEDLPLEGSLLRFSMIFAQKLGYKVSEVPIDHRVRLFGKSKFGVVKYLRIIYDLILILLLFSGSGKIRNRIKIKK